MVTVKTSLLKTYSNRPLGFTLLEVLLVLAILGALIGFGLPKLRSPQTNIRAVSRQISALAREVRNEARMKRRTYRIVFRMGVIEDSNSSSKNKAASKNASADSDGYWVESAAGNFVIPSEATLEKIKGLDEKDRPSNPFSRVERYGKKEKTLPTGLFFGSIETSTNQQPITNGLAYIYFTPEGLTQQSIIQITDRKKITWSLIFNPITGHADIVEKATSLQELSK